MQTSKHIYLQEIFTKRDPKIGPLITITSLHTIKIHNILKIYIVFSYISLLLNE